MVILYLALSLHAPKFRWSTCCNALCSQFFYGFTAEILYCISEVVSHIGLTKSSKLVKQCLMVKQRYVFLNSSKKLEIRQIQR